MTERIVVRFGLSSYSNSTHVLPVTYSMTEWRNIPNTYKCYTAERLGTCFCLILSYRNIRNHFVEKGWLLFIGQKKNVQNISNRIVIFLDDRNSFSKQKKGFKIRSLNGRVKRVLS